MKTLLSISRSFLTQDQLQSEAQRFLEDGEYCGNLGDLVLPALVNVLSQPVTIFTSVENMPIIALMPISSVVVNSNPLFIAYNQNQGYFGKPNKKKMVPRVYCQVYVHSCHAAMKTE